MRWIIQRLLSTVLLSLVLATSCHAQTRRSAPQDCTQDVLATSLATLRQRNAVAEAQESVRLRDFRPMIYISSALGVLTPKALGLRCPNGNFQGKESYGAAGDAITRCIGEQLARVQQFVEEYNRELDRIAGKNGIDICAGKKRATIP